MKTFSSPAAVRSFHGALRALAFGVSACLVTTSLFVTACTQALPDAATTDVATTSASSAEALATTSDVTGADAAGSAGSNGHGHGRGQRGEPGRPHRAPPPEAFEACAAKSAGDACSVTLGAHTLSGTCNAPPPDANETRLACRPSGPPPGGGAPPDGAPRRGHGPRGDAKDDAKDDARDAS